MKKIFITSLILTIGLMLSKSWADAAVDEIIDRYNASLPKAKNFCSGLSEKIDQVKLMSGIGIGAGAVGTVAGGTALVTGLIKRKTDEEIAKLEEEMEKSTLTEEQIAAMTPQQALDKLKEIDEYLRAKNEQLLEKKNSSQTLGSIRTVGSFASGAGGAAGAITSLSGAGMLDKLIEDMNACDSYVREIEKQKTELTFVAPDDSMIAQMNKIVENCKGMDSKNIADIKGKLKAAGIISAVGAAGGITGGITSAIAVSREKNDGASATGAEGQESTKGLNMAANISAGVATAGNLGGAILSGVVLSGLMKNGDVAKACRDAF